MKKIRIPRRTRHRPFAEKFAKDAVTFGSGEMYTPPDYGSLPWLLLGMLGLTILTTAILLLGKLPKVGTVTADEGNYYTATAVLAHAGIETGDELWGFDSFAKAKELKEKLPLMEKVKIRKRLNGDVTVSFTEVERLYYTRHNQNYYIINADTRDVLCVSADATEARRVGATYLGLPECARVRVGEPLTFINLPYLPETDAWYTCHGDTAWMPYTFERGVSCPDSASVQLYYTNPFLTVVLENGEVDFLTDQPMVVTISIEGGEWKILSNELLSKD